MRTRNGPARKRRVKKLLKAAKGYRAAKSTNYRQAKQTVQRAGRYGFIDRRRKKREYRSLWILRINAAVRAAGITYSKFISGLHKAGVVIDRRQLSELAINDASAFQALVDTARKAS